MLTVKTPDEVDALIQEAFPARPVQETISLGSACGRVLCQPIVSTEYIPGFDRSTVDGYAVRASDTFGCSDAIPAILPLSDEITMGSQAARPLSPGCCAYIPTGGALPPGTDAVVMQEYTENYGDGSVGVTKPVAPGVNLIFKGDDARPGQTILPAGRLLTVPDIGTLAAMGITQVPVCRRPVAGILSTGDELVPVSAQPATGQVRDVNSAMLASLVESAGGQARCYGILPDQEGSLSEALDQALAQCDLVLISGGSSVGIKDAACRVLSSKGEILFHGIAMKPGKPTLLGRANGKPVFGLPGHPAAAFFVSHLFVRPLLARMVGRTPRAFTIPAILTEPVSANHGCAQYNGAFLSLRGGNWYASPVRGKSGLIAALAASDGYFCIPRDCEGIAAGETVSVTVYTTD